MRIAGRKPVTLRAAVRRLRKAERVRVTAGIGPKLRAEVTRALRAGRRVRVAWVVTARDGARTGVQRRTVALRR